MQVTDPKLLALGAALERSGHVVVPHATDLCVRLPLLCSIRVAHGDRGFRFHPRFGPLARTTSLIVTSAAAVGVVGATALATSSIPALAVAVIAGITALAHNVCRFVITEGCLSRLQVLVTRQPPGQPLEALPYGEPASRPIDMSPRHRHPIS